MGALGEGPGRATVSARGTKDCVYWKVELSADLEAADAPQIWFDIPARYGACEGGLDIASDGVLLAIEAFDEDIMAPDVPKEVRGV